MTLRKKAISGFIWSFIDKVGNQSIYFIVTIYLANQLGPEAFGLVGMLAIFVVFSDSLVNSGFSQALVQRSKKATDSDFSTVFFTNIAMGSLIYGILFFSAPYISEFYGDQRLEAAAQVLFLIIIVNAFAVVAKARLTINIDFKSQTFANTTATIISAVVAIVMVHHDYGYWALVGMTIARATINTLMLWFFSGWHPVWVYSVTSLKKLFSFGSKLMIAGLVATSLNNLYVLLVGRYFDSTQVGYLTQSTTLTNTMSGIITSVLHGVTYPIMTSVNDDEQRMVKIYKQLIQLTFLIAVPSMLGFAVLAESFTQVFLSAEWTPIVPLLVLLSLARMITPISAVNMNILNAIGRSDLFLKIDLIKLPMTLLAILVSVQFGIEAVAFAMFATSFISYFINAYYPGKFYSFGPIEQIKATWRIILAGIIMVAATVLFSSENDVVELLGKMLIGGISYIGSCALLREPTFYQLLNMLKQRKQIKIKV